MRFALIMSVTSAMWLKGSSGVLELTAAPNYNEDTNILIRGFGVRGAYLHICIEADPTDTTGQADFDKLGELSIIQMKRPDEYSEYGPDDDALEIEVVADWQLAFQEDDGKACYFKQVRGFLGQTQLYAESDMQVKVFPDAWESDLSFVLTAIFTPFIACLGFYFNF